MNVILRSVYTGKNYNDTEAILCSQTGEITQIKNQKENYESFDFLHHLIVSTDEDVEALVHVKGNEFVIDMKDVDMFIKKNEAL